MNILIFGATGMVGQGVLRECLRAIDVDAVTVVGRSSTGHIDPRLNEILMPDLSDLSAQDAKLAGFDACFFCLGVSSAGMSEANYTRITFDLTTSLAGRLARLNPQMTFVYVSGARTDSSEQGRTMWARVKGRTENALQRLPFRAVYLFRPGAIEATNGERSKTPLYNVLYPLLRPLFKFARMIAPDSVTTTEEVGRAMLEAVRHGAPHAILEMADIRALGRHAESSAGAAAL